VTRRDFVVALRTLVHSPVFTITAALTMAIGIGATTAIFSVADAVLIRPLPYKDPGRLVLVYSDLRARDNLGMPSSNENFVDIRDGTKTSFDDMAAVLTARQVLPGADGSPEQVRLAVVTVNFFRLMGASVVRGRDFIDSDGVPQQQAAPTGPPGAAPAPAGPPLPTSVILSYEYWQRRFGGDPSVIGQSLQTGGQAVFQIVGVLQPGFELLFPPADGVEARPDLWLANRLTYDNANRNGYGLHPVGRLKAGVTLAQAQQDVERIAAGIRHEFPIYGTANYYARLAPMHDALVARVQPAIVALMGAGIFLLLIACANVANLLIVRASLRQTEFAVRSALGAGAWRLVGAMLAEAFVLAAIGIAGGVALAWAGVRALLAVAPPNLPRLDHVSIDGTVLAFAVASGLAAALIFGLAPAWSALRLSALRVLRGSGRTEGLGLGGRLRHAVVALEVALCFVLLVGSGLMARSFFALERIDPGFNPHGLLTFQLLGGRGGPPAQRQETMRELERTLDALPGVTGATASTPFPLAGGFSTIRWGMQDALADNSRYQAVDWQVVQPGYFKTMGMRLLDGRTFTDADNQPDQLKVVVDDVLARKAYPRESAVGKQILIRIRTPEPERVEVIGVVAHQRNTSIADPGREQVYFADGFLNFGRARVWAVRTSGDPAALSSAVRAAVAHVDPQFAVTGIQPMDALVDRAEAGTRFQLLLVSVFAVVAALLVAVGLYGVLATMVRQRTAEIGVRMALGASPTGILRLVIGYGLRLSAAGMVVGLAGAFGLTQLLRSLLVGVQPTDPVTYASMVVVFLAIAALSAWLPARRAAALDPTRALRNE
jgi:putative ABC transport system permease protein